MNPIVALTRLRARLCLVAASALLGLSACGSGGGGGGSNNTTSRDLPADPGPAATATTAGVDTNSNAVRDEVEIKLSSEISDDSQYRVALKVAAAYQAILLNPEPTTRDEALQAYGRILCAPAGATSVYGQSNAAIQVLTFDTPDRMAKFAALNSKLGGGFFGEELPACQ